MTYEQLKGRLDKTPIPVKYEAARDRILDLCDSSLNSCILLCYNRKEKDDLVTVLMRINVIFAVHPLACGWSNIPERFIVWIQITRV